MRRTALHSRIRLNSFEQKKIPAISWGGGGGRGGGGRGGRGEGVRGVGGGAV